MQRYKDVPKQSSSEVLDKGKVAQPFWPWPFLTIAIIITWMSLACAFIGTASRSTADVGLIRLPTLTRTPLPTLTPTINATALLVGMAPQTAATTTALPPLLSSPATVTVALTPSQATAPIPNVAEADLLTIPADALTTNVSTPPTPVANLSSPLTVATATALPSPTSVPTSTATETPLPTDTPTATPIPEDWMFSGARVYSDQYEGGLLLRGNVTNNTGAAQELLAITGTFYDAQGQVIAGADRIYAYWPGYVIPPGGHVPFEMMVDGINGAADFHLEIEATPSEEVPHQDFEIADLNQWNENNVYCLKGKLRNPVGALQDYLIIAAVLYDAQDNIIDFGDYEEFGLTTASAGDSSEFEICVEPPDQNVARYEIQVWGR